jgi:hypothetical protein
MKKKTILWMLTLLMMSAASVNAQVIIGDNTTINPHAGAVLDLSPLGAKNLGLLLPNVSLAPTVDAVKGETIFVLVEETHGNITAIKASAVGMLVYNANPDGAIGEGIYVWTGQKWQVIVRVKN